MRNIYLLLIFLISSANLSAQTQSDPVQGNNLLKINLLALPLKNISLEYERPVSEKIAISLGFRFMPESALPLKSTYVNLIDDEETTRQIDQFKTGNIAITPSVKFYLGKKQAPQGFYIAPFLRYSHITAHLPSYEFDVTVNNYTFTETIPLNGSINGYTGGILFGAQWKLSKVLYLDWWILGASYGFSDGSVSGRKNLSEPEQQYLRDELEDLDIPLVTKKITVDGNGAKLDFNGPFAGLRSGLSLGFRF